MPVCFVEGSERRPAFASLLGADERLQRKRTKALALKCFDQRCQLRICSLRADKIEPCDTTARRLGPRKSAPTSSDRLLHQGDQMPGKGAPGRFHVCVPFRV